MRPHAWFAAVTVALAGMLLPCTAQSAASSSNQPDSKKATLSTSRPTDSLGEPVYEFNGPLQQDHSAAPGAFTTPVPLNRSYPEYPESMRRNKEPGEVVVEGVVSQEGHFIDLKAVRSSDPAFNDNAIEAAARYVFRPATLDGKPVACLLRVKMTFSIH